MADWEQEVFEREYSDLSWYKGKQAKHQKELENGKKKSGLSTWSQSGMKRFIVDHLTALSPEQRKIFDQIKAFVLGGRRPSSSAPERLALVNDFPARDRAFLTTLAQELHLDLGWDEYDEYDQNLMTLRIPRAIDDEGKEVEDTGGSDSEWEDEGELESHLAVDRVLKKYEKAAVVDLEEQGTFEERHARAVKDKMDEWKRGYYRVRGIILHLMLRLMTN